MARGLTTAVSDAVQAEQVVVCTALDFDFPSGFLRLATSPGTIQIGGQDYLGVGNIIGISSLDESTELRSFGMAVQLAGIPRDAISIALGEAYRNRRAQIWEVPFVCTTWQPLADPVLLFRGRMDQMSIELGATATVKITLENRMRDWERAPGILWTHDEQQLRHAGDTFFAFVSDTAKTVTWPGASFKGGGQPGGGSAAGGPVDISGGGY
jgi:hypothetical protein